MQIFQSGKVYNFMGSRRLFALLSTVLVLGSIVALFTVKPKLGTDFVGGTELEVAFKSAVDDEDIRKAAEAAGFSTPDVIRVKSSTPHHFLIRVQEVTAIDEAQEHAVESALCFGKNVDPGRCPEEARAAEVKISPGGDKISVRYSNPPDLQRIKQEVSTVKGIALREGDNNPLLQNARDNRVEIQLKSKGDQLLDGLRANLGTEVVPDAALRVEWVGPKAGQQLRDAALKAIAIALIFVMVYIAFRFDLRFSPGAVIALAHDALVTVGLLTLLQQEINLSTVAALLTIVGYSVNDTVVVYDRVRENLGILRGSSFLKIINTSLSEMLGRTILTSGTTIFSLMAFFYWGTGTLKDFAFTLIIGVAFGTYSSIGVALPLTHLLDRKVFSHIGRQQARRPISKKKASAVV